MLLCNVRTFYNSVARLSNITYSNYFVCFRQYSLSKLNDNLLIFLLLKRFVIYWPENCSNYSGIFWSLDERRLQCDKQSQGPHSCFVVILISISISRHLNKKYFAWTHFSIMAIIFSNIKIPFSKKNYQNNYPSSLSYLRKYDWTNYIS